MTELTQEGLELQLPDGRTVRVRLRALDDYQQNAENPVAHPERNRQLVMDSVRKLRALRSGVAKDGKLAAGNLTQQAMREAGITDVVEVSTDGEAWVMVDRSNLTEEDFKLAAYYDQQSGMLAAWDADQVAADAAAGLDLSGLWMEDELRSVSRAQLDQDFTELGMPDDLPPIDMEGWGIKTARAIIIFEDEDQKRSALEGMGFSYSETAITYQWGDLAKESNG